MLAVAGVTAAYALLRARRTFSHQESWWRTVGRGFAAVALATAVWLGVDWVRGEDWIWQMVCALPDLHENAIRYSVLIAVGWLGWSVALFEGLRWAAIVRQRRHAVPGSSESGAGPADPIDAPDRAGL
jgi:hypothetical protein